MKKTLLMLALAVAGAQSIHAQEVETNGGKREITMQEHLRFELVNRGYTNFAYVTQRTIEPVTGLKSESSKWGAAFSKGRNYVINHRPFAGMIFVAVNASWFDANYARYEFSTGDAKAHQLDLSVGIGPSIHVVPVGKLGVHAYCRYHPGYGAYAAQAGSEFTYVTAGFVNGVIAGGAVSWGAIAFGAEARWGTGDYKLKTEDKTYSSEAGELKTAGLRGYLSLRF
jgi:nucleoside-specific outer membrane channel protein Tsx